MRPTKENLIPFDLKKALEGDPVIMRDGTKVINIFYIECLDEPGICSVLAITTSKNKCWYDKDGKYGKYQLDDEYRGDICFDLFMAPKPKKTKWVAIYKNAFGDIITTMHTYDSEYSAIQEFGRDDECATFLKTISFEV